MSEHSGEKDDQVESLSLSDEEISLSSERGSWNNKVEYILACIGYSVGLGNAWRFPTVCYENGGGAFLIPYIIMLLLIGKPMYLMELALGQYTRQGTPGCYKFAPIATGAGYATLLIAMNIAIYYNVLMVYTLYFAFASFQKVLPWTRCDHEYNTINCQSFNYSFPNQTRYSNATLPSEEYYYRKVLQSHESTGIGEIGPVKLDLLGLLILSWAIVFLILFKGIKSAGKVVYVTATLPYLILLILLIRGLTLKGSLTGIKYFIYPDFNKIMSPNVWQKAAGQMFFSLSLTFGGLMTYASFIPFHNNCHIDAIIVSVLDTLTSLIAGFVIFSILGFMAYVKHKSVPDVVASGPGLAFVTYPEVLSRMPWPNFFSFLFFLMLYTLGIDSQIAFIETIQTSLHDQFPQHFPRSRKIPILAILCTIGCILGLPCITRGGTLVLDLMDHYASNTCCIVVAITETVAIMWIYGYKRFTADISFMIGHPLPGLRYWQFSWAFFTPIGLTAILIGFFINSIFYDRRFVSGNYVYPIWAQFVGYTIFCVIVFQIPLWGYLRIRKSPGDTFKEKFKYALRPTKSLEKMRVMQEKKSRDLITLGQDNVAAALDDV